MLVTFLKCMSRMLSAVRPYLCVCQSFLRDFACFLKKCLRLKMAKMWVTWPNQLRITVLISLKCVANPLSLQLEKNNNSVIYRKPIFHCLMSLPGKTTNYYCYSCASSQLLTGSLASMQSLNHLMELFSNKRALFVETLQPDATFGEMREGGIK